MASGKHCLIDLNSHDALHPRPWIAMITGKGPSPVGTLAMKLRYPSVWLPEVSVRFPCVTLLRDEAAAASPEYPRPSCTEALAWRETWSSGVFASPWPATHAWW